MNKNKITYYKKVAQYLLLSLKIPNNQSLIITFGSGTERTNEEAMITWIQNLNIDLELYEKEQGLNHLKEAAKEHIEHTMDFC